MRCMAVFSGDRKPESRVLALKPSLSLRSLQGSEGGTYKRILVLRRVQWRNQPSFRGKLRHSEKEFALDKTRVSV